MEKIKDFLWAFKQNKKAQIIIAVILGIILLALAGYLTYTLLGDDVELDGKIIKSNVVKEEMARKIDGVVVPGERANYYPTAIVIENLQSVRPQAGLSQANLVYETLAEGGITRFLAIYASGDSIPVIGPVRSARTYFVDWAEEYSGLFAHIGGSPEALGILNSEDQMIDLNQFYNAEYFWRDENILAPHNLMSSSEKLAYAIRDKVGEDVEGEYTGWVFKDEAEVSERAEQEQTIGIDFSSDSYKVEWKYDPETNYYLRFNAGEEHQDSNNNEQLKAKNIVIQYTETSLSDSEGRLDIVTQGEGKAIIFQDGNIIEGTWKKEERGMRTLYYDENDVEVEFNVGTTWIEVLSEDRPVTY